jgi:NAD(P)-dependent dehydrogenase (short-subunit alcohol dehydrogenase family)
MAHTFDEAARSRYAENFRITDFNKMMAGKVVIITGASYGMGKMFAQIMCEQGAKVFVTARGEEKLMAAIEDIREKTGGEITGITADSSKPADCKKVFDKALEAYGTIDVLINNAGKGELITIDAVDDDMIDAVVDTNMKGPLYLCREAVRYFLTKDEGNIINISSANGVRPMCGAAYCSTKGGLNTLTKNVAIRCTGTGIRCNAVAPGHTPSPTAYAHDDGGPKTVEMGYMNDIRNARTVRTVHPWEIDQAYAVLFLASDMSRCINGEVLCVDCGCYL